MQYSQERPAFEQILNLYDSVGWTNYTQKPTMLEKAFAASLFTLYAYEGENLIGLIRAVGDGHSSVFIQDLLVNPSHQRQGIGRELVKRTLAHFPDAYQIQLATEKSDKTLKFYQSLGFVELDDLQCTGMIYQRK